MFVTNVARKIYMLLKLVKDIFVSNVFEWNCIFFCVQNIFLTKNRNFGILGISNSTDERTRTCFGVSVFLFGNIRRKKFVRRNINMPLYEASLTLKLLSRPELISSLKRSAETIVQQGGVLRQFLSLGTNPLPYRMKAHNTWHKEGTYFVMKFDAPSATIEILTDEFKRDIDLIRSHVVKLEERAKEECTLEEELQPPAYRKDVQKLLEEGRKSVRPMYKQNTPGFDYYPFQK